jgi:hypothetical protein
MYDVKMKKLNKRDEYVILFAKYLDLVESLSSYEALRRVAVENDTFVSELIKTFRQFRLAFFCKKCYKETESLADVLCEDCKEKKFHSRTTTVENGEVKKLVRKKFNREAFSNQHFKKPVSLRGELEGSERKPIVKKVLKRTKKEWDEVVAKARKVAEGGAQINTII